MPDDKSNRSGGDRTPINIHEEYERQYWAKKFGISAGELERLVQNVGPMVEDVNDALSSRKG